MSKNKSVCAEPYTRVGLRDTEVAGKPAAELEYTCGSQEQRHGIWRVVMDPGTESHKAYGFYLTTPESRFAESLPVFQEMVNSFKLTGTS